MKSMNTTPPTVPASRVNRSSNTFGKFLIALAICAGVLFGVLLLGRICGLVRTFVVSTGGMTPTISAGDKILMENVTFLKREPRRGDIVVFDTTGISGLRQDSFFVQRVAGEPGDRVRITEGKLYINERRLSLSNATGEIVYIAPPIGAPGHIQTTVPENTYYTLGDNPANSLDSRYFDCVPRKNIIGRIIYCYSPAKRAGPVK